MQNSAFLLFSKYVLSFSIQDNIYQLLQQYHNTLAVCNIQGEQTCEFCRIDAITVLSNG